MTNIIEHVKCFNRIEYPVKMMSFQIMIDDISVSESIVKKIEKLLKILNVENFDLITNYNWGGTILGLWLSYKKYSEIYKDCYLAHFEEDFRPIDNNWLKSSIEKLQEDVYYIGESNIGRKKTGNDDQRITNRSYQNTVRLGYPEVWLDGGYYFSTLKKLRVIHDSIGIFHKGDPKTKYERILDGISIGEVGFPTLVHNSGLKFDFLFRKNYFIHHG